MKTQHLLQIVSVSALFAMTISLSASEPLLSPRVKDNQIKIAASVDNSPNTVTQNKNTIAAPRVADNQIKTVAVTSSGTDTLVCSRRMMASPKAIGECASHSGGPMSCCSVASAK